MRLFVPSGLAPWEEKDSGKVLRMFGQCRKSEDSPNSNYPSPTYRLDHNCQAKGKSWGLPVAPQLRSVTRHDASVHSMQF